MSPHSTAKSPLVQRLDTCCLYKLQCLHMHILSVSPLGKSRFSELSYFSQADIRPGAVIDILIRGKKVKGVVLASEDARDMKEAIRGASFELKKINIKEAKLFVPFAALRAAEETALFYGASVGNVLGETINTNLLPHLTKETGEKKPGVALILQEGEEHRMSYYRSIIRESFSKGKSSLIITPTIEESNRLSETLEKGISEFVVVLHSGISKKELAARLQKIETEIHPILIVCTPSFAVVPRADLETLVIERESSPSYEETFGQSFFDNRLFLESFGVNSGLRVILADTLLRPETVARYLKGGFQEALSPSWRIGKIHPFRIVAMEKEKEVTEGILSRRVLDLITEISGRLGNIFLFVARRGLYTTTVCGDCGTTLLCNCGKPLVLHEEGSARYYLCHTCGNSLRIEKGREVTCLKCGGWRLSSFGVGTQNVKKILDGLLPKGKVLLIDSDSTTPTEAKKVSLMFESGEGTVLIGTEMAIPYLRGTISKSIIVSLDSLFAIGSYKNYERILSLITRIAEKTDGETIIQTRLQTDKIFSYIESRNVQEFYRDELNTRKEFLYPPFGVLLRLRWEHPGVETEIKNICAPHEVLLYEGSHKGRNKMRFSALSKIPADEWSPGIIQAKIRALPFPVQISVNEDI